MNKEASSTTVWGTRALIAGCVFVWAALPATGEEAVSMVAHTPASSGTASNSFEAFELPQPTNVSTYNPLAPTTNPLPTFSASGALLTPPSGPPKKRLQVSSTLSLTPWDQTLLLGFNGVAGLRSFSSYLEINPRTGLPLVNAGYLSLQQQDSTLRLGQSSDDLYGGISGLRYTVNKKKGPSYGGGVYSLASGADSRFVLGLDAQLPLGANNSVGALFGADGSWRLLTRRQTRKLSAYAHIGALGRSGGNDWTLATTSNLGLGTSLSQRFTGRNGRSAYQADATTLFFRLGAPMFYLDRWSSRDTDTQARQQSASMFLPVGRNQLSVRYQRLSIDEKNGKHQRDNLWSGGLWHTTPGGVMLYGQGEMAESGKLGWNAGTSLSIFQQNQLTFEIGQRPGAGFSVRRARLSFRLNPDADIAVQYGPAIGRHGVGRIGWGVDLTRRFNWASSQNGSIEGNVSVVDAPIPAKMMLALDNKVRVPVDANGHFILKKVPEGVHTLRVDLSSIPAELGVDSPSVEVQVYSKQKSNVSFRLQRLGRVTGTIRALHTLSNEVKASHPFKGMVLVLSNGKRTLTEEDGSYRFDNLLPGNYEVELPLESIPEGFVGVGPMKWPIQIRMGGVVSQADFTLDSKENAIQFEEFKPEGEDEPPVKVEVAPVADQSPAKETPKQKAETPAQKPTTIETDPPGTQKPVAAAPDLPVEDKVSSAPTGETAEVAQKVEERVRFFRAENGGKKASVLTCRRNAPPRQVPL